MANVTLSVPDEFKRRMDAHPEIRWSSAIRAVLEQRLDDLEQLDRLLAKSTFTTDDAEEMAKKVDQAATRHVRKLLHETRY